MAEESKKTSDTETKIRIAGEIDRIAETIIRTDWRREWETFIAVSVMTERNFW